MNRPNRYSPIHKALRTALFDATPWLEEKCPDVLICPVRRGRFELQVGCAVQLRESDSA